MHSGEDSTAEFAELLGVVRSTIYPPSNDNASTPEPG
jgi:hypothetical protein